MLIGAFILGVILGGVAVWLILRERVRRSGARPSDMTDTFKALSAETLQQTTTSFLDLAKDKIEGVATAQLLPIKESLQRFDEKVERLEQARQLERGALSEQLLALKDGADKLRGETASLVGRRCAPPQVRGQWGELQLKRHARARRHARALRLRPGSLDHRRRRAPAGLTSSCGCPAGRTSSSTRRSRGSTALLTRSRPTTPR